jgi:hypothetical protein
VKPSTPREIENTRFSDNSPTEVVSIPDMPIGEMRQFCRMQIEKQKQLDDTIIKLFRQAVPTGLGFATRNYLGAK